MTRAATQGRKARRTGNEAERLVMAAQEHYGARGVPVTLRKLPTPSRRVGAKGRVTGLLPHEWVAVYSSDAGCDYRGTLPGGRSLVAEVKSSGSPSLPLKRQSGKPTVSTKQAEELAAETAAGAAAGVLVRITCKPRGMPKVEEWYWLGWAGWDAATNEAKADGAASLSRDRLQQHGTRCGTLLGGAPDWLRAVLTTIMMEEVA